MTTLFNIYLQPRHARGKALEDYRSHDASRLIMLSDRAEPAAQFFPSGSSVVRIPLSVCRRSPSTDLAFPVASVDATAYYFVRLAWAFGQARFEFRLFGGPEAASVSSSLRQAATCSGVAASQMMISLFVPGARRLPSVGRDSHKPHPHVLKERIGQANQFFTRDGSQIRTVRSRAWLIRRR